jgi:hypothetical protein
LSKNPNIFEFKNMINEPGWDCLYSNPAIFTYDYDKIKTHFFNLNKEIIEWVYHPSRINKWIWILDE